MSICQRTAAIQFPFQIYKLWAPPEFEAMLSATGWGNWAFEKNPAAHRHTRTVEKDFKRPHVNSMSSDSGCAPTSSGELGRKRGFSMSSSFLMPSITLSLRVRLNSFSLSHRARLNRRSSLVLKTQRTQVRFTDVRDRIVGKTNNV